MYPEDFFNIGDEITVRFYNDVCSSFGETIGEDWALVYPLEHVISEKVRKFADSINKIVYSEYKKGNWSKYIYNENIFMQVIKKDGYEIEFLSCPDEECIWENVPGKIHALRIKKDNFILDSWLDSISEMICCLYEQNTSKEETIRESCLNHKKALNEITIGVAEKIIDGCLSLTFDE